MDQHFFTIEFLLPKPIICIVEKQETRRDSECCSLFFLSGIFSVTKRAIKEESRERKLRRHKDDKLSQLHPPQLRALCNTSLPESEMADSPCKIHQPIQILFSHFFYSKAEAICLYMYVRGGIECRDLTVKSRARLSGEVEVVVDLER